MFKEIKLGKERRNKEDKLKLSISETKFNHLLEYIIKEYDAYGPVKTDGKLVFSRLKSPSDLCMFCKKTIIPFKNIIFPEKQFIDNKNKSPKIALVGLNNCDIWALHRFWDQFENTNILMPKENLLVVGMECRPDENCFCEAVGTNQYAPFDLFVQEGKNGIQIFSESVKANNILKKIGLKEDNTNIKLKKIEQLDEVFDQKQIGQIIENKNKNIELWMSLSNNCFGCGACSTVCPLCFCTRQYFENNTEGQNTQCLKWDSCFAKCFSEIQNRHDLRPNNVDRFYNWYHHKFIRSYFKNKYALCTGCGRCIDACPAHLNIKNILNLLIQKNT